MGQPVPQERFATTAFERRLGCDHDGEVGRKIASWKAGDPVARLEQHMVGRAMLSPDELRAIRDQVTSELDEAVAFADASPFPDPKDLMADMFAE